MFVYFQDGDDGSGSEYEFEYDDKGRIIKQKRVNAKVCILYEVNFVMHLSTTY